MSRLTKFLESLMSKSDSVHIATTNSRYYKIGDLKIGVSDHFPEASNISCHIRIVNPLNAKTVYLVQVKEGPQILTFNFAGVKTFISNYIYVKQIQKLNSEVKANRTTVKNKKKEADLTCNKFDNSNWIAFWEAVKKKVPHYKTIMATKKREVVYKIMANCSVKEVSDALIKAHENGVLVAGSSALALEQFLRNL